MPPSASTNAPAAPAVVDEPDDEFDAAPAPPPRPPGPPRSDPTVVSDVARRRLGRLYLAIYAVVVVFGYPLAVLPPAELIMANKPVMYAVYRVMPGMFDLLELPFNVHLPVAVLVTLGALPVLLAGRWWLRRGWGIAAAVFVVGCIVSAALHRDYPWLTLELLGYVVGPLAVAVLVRDGLLPGNRRLFLYVLGFWAINVVYGYLQSSKGGLVSGLPGNPNWVAVLLVALLPWVITAVAHLLLRPESIDVGGNAAKPARLPRPPVWLAWGIAVVVVTAISLPLLARCHSRAAWLALAVQVTVLALWQLRLWLRVVATVALGLTVLVAGMVVAIIKADGMERAVGDDVRLPMWGSTGALIMDHDLAARAIGRVFGRTGGAAIAWRDVSGVGAGNFQKVFAPYRAKSRYSLRAVAAPTSIHPHNEFLNIAAQIGLIPALAWLLLMLSVLARPRDLLSHLGALGAIAGLVGAMFDMTLVQQPVNVVIWFCLGVAWASRLGDLPTWATRPALAGLRKAALSLAVLALIAGGVGYSVWTLRVDWQSRRAYSATHDNDKDYAAAIDAYTRALELAPHDRGLRYQRASLYLRTPGQLPLALADFKIVYEGDPNYVHINDMLGTAMVGLGQLESAYALFTREVELYPNSLEAQEHLYSIAIATGRLALANASENRHRQLVFDHVRRRHDEATIGEQLDHWATAVRQGDRDGALRIANALFVDVHLGFQDPLLFVASGDYEWPRETRAAVFDDGDFSWWRLAARLHERTLAQPDELPLARLQRCLTALTNEITLEPPTTPPADFVPATAVFNRKATAPVAGYAVVTMLARQIGYRTLLLYDATDAPVGCVFFDADHHAWRYAWGGELQEQPAGQWDGPAPDGLTVRVYAPFFTLFLKNQMLGALQHAYRPDDEFLSWEYPSLVVSMVALQLQDADHPAPAPPSIFVPDEVQAVIRRLRSGAPEAPASP